MLKLMGKKVFTILFIWTDVIVIFQVPCVTHQRLPVILLPALMMENVLLMEMMRLCVCVLLGMRDSSARIE